MAAGLGIATNVDVSGTADDTGRAGGQVLDVDRFDDGVDTWTTVDVQFEAAGERVVTTLDWPSRMAVPAVGDVVPVAYDPSDPERAAEASTVSPPNSGPDVPDGDLAVLAACGAVAGALALAALVATAIWATRAPRPEVRSQPYPAYRPPPGGYPPSPYPPSPSPYPPAPPPGGWPTPR